MSSLAAEETVKMGCFSFVQMNVKEGQEKRSGNLGKLCQNLTRVPLIKTTKIEPL